MTISELKEKLGDLKDNERERYLWPLFKMFSPLSTNQLRDFQNSWDGHRPFEEFCAAQNKQIIASIDMEISIFPNNQFSRTILHSGSEADADRD